MLTRIKKVAALLFLISPLLLIILSRTAPVTESKVAHLASGKFDISGFLGIAKPRKRTTPIYVPGVEVELRDPLTEKVLAKVRTDLSGRFRFPSQAPSRYKICWSAPGIVHECTDLPMFNEHHYLGLLPMNVDTQNGARMFYGTVRFADGKLPRKLEPMLGINTFATVTARDAGGSSLGQAYVNNYGEYVLPVIKESNKYQLVGSIESASIARSVAFQTGWWKEEDLVFNKQHVPEISGLVSNDSNGKHWTVTPGETVKVRALAIDRDGDALQYRWILPDGTFMATASSDDTVSFQIPPREGVYEFTALVSDGHGGYSKESISLSTNGVHFSGTVAATDAAKVKDALIEVNGKSVQSDTNGYFSIFVPESARYVMNIRKDGYGLVSKIYDNSLTGGHWVLTRASVESVNPSQPISVVNTRAPADCPGPLSDHLTEGVVCNEDYRYQRHNKNSDCGPGIGVQIPANALVDEDGKPPTGNVNMELTTIDLRSPDGMPGDYTAQDRNGNQRVMQSYGAGAVEIKGDGKKYHIKAGETAQVTIPIDPEQLAAGSTPHKIPLLSYDEKTGVWMEEGEAQRVGNAYVGTVKHFSVVNADTLKVNQACLRLETAVMPPKFNLEVTVPQSNGTNRVVSQQIDNLSQRFHVIINLPVYQNIQLRALNSDGSLIQLLDVSNVQHNIDINDPLNKSLNQLIVNSDGQQSSASKLPEFPYAACRRSVELTPFFPVSDTADTFLHGRGAVEALNLTELDPTNSNTFADAIKFSSKEYYKLIDPFEKRATLAGFKKVNGFPAKDEISLQYVNSGDLGFGRDMHCRQIGSDIFTGNEYACYVTNYGSRFTSDDDDYSAALNNSGPVATVAMEFSRSESPVDISGKTLQGNPFVKFYVYKEADGNNRAVSANLDGSGERPVPQLCMVCHGGHYPQGVSPQAGAPIWFTAQSGDLGSHFIPFDLLNMYPVQNLSQDTVRELNCDIVRHAPPSAELEEVITSMYASTCVVQGQGQRTGYPVPGWYDYAGTPSKADVYANVVAPSCRSCHLSQSPSNITWADAQTFLGYGGIISSLVCTKHAMPHALVTHNRFWLSTSPHQPLLLNDFFAANGISTDCIKH
ncbi:MAG: hypothetical protein WBP93_19030 [Pyrinomonadaceae bacterium]